MRVSVALERFLTAIRADGLSGETLAWYRKRLSRFVQYSNDCEIGKIALDDLRLFVVSLQQQDTKWAHHKYLKPVHAHLSPSTIQSYVRCLKRFYNWLESERYITTGQNAALRLKKPKIPRQAPKEIAESDILILLDVSLRWGRYPIRNHAMILFLAETGVRVGGLVGLRVGDIDLEKGRAVVIEKGNKSRPVYFGQECKDALGAWLARRPQDTEYVFVGDRGHLRTDGVRLILKHLQKFAGIKGRVNPHSFRHAFAKRMSVHGGDVAFLSALMGHSDIKVTRDSYLIYFDRELQEAHRRYASLDGVLQQPIS